LSVFGSPEEEGAAGRSVGEPGRADDQREGHRDGRRAEGPDRPSAAAHDTRDGVCHVLLRYALR
jgi:hypothetical protein